MVRQVAICFALFTAFTLPAMAAPPGAHIVPVPGVSTVPQARGLSATNTCGVSPYAPGCSGAMTTLDGPVMHGDATTGIVNVYLIWFGFHQTPAFQGLVERFVNGIGSSNYLGTVGLYSDSQGGAATNVRLGGGHSIFLNSTTCPGVSETLVLDDDIRSIISCAGVNLEPLQTSMYVVITAPGIDQGPGFCSDYCGWHSFTTLGGGRRAEAFVGVPSGNCCVWPDVTTPNGVTADSVISVLAHEITETLTDPDVATGWSANCDNGEIADLCAWQVCPDHGGTINGASYTHQVGSDYFYLQDLWANAGNSGQCVGGSLRTPVVTLQSSSTATTFGSNVTLTATVKAPAGAPQPTGTVVFRSNGASLGTVQTTAGNVTSTGHATAVASFSTQSFGVGTQSLTADFSGDSLYAEAQTASSISLTVTGRAISISASSTSVAPGGTVVMVANGGAGDGYAWDIQTNASHGSITQEGVYTAGSTGDVTDTIRVRDNQNGLGTVAITIGPRLIINRSGAAVAPLGSDTLVASGGSGVIASWAISDNQSGGSITSRGVYTAGGIGGVVDTVQVTDSLGSSQVATIQVGPNLTITPPSSPVSPRATVLLTASGGSGTVSAWEFLTNNSGGTLGSDGTFVAGTIANVQDFVKATDTLGNVAVAPVSVGSGLIVRTTSVTVAPRATTTLVPTGGSGRGYRFTLTRNDSGGFVTADGFYTAGPVASTRDIVQAVDSLGNTASVSIDVGVGVTIQALDQIPAIPGFPLMLFATGGTGTGYSWSPVEMPSQGTISGAGLYTPGSHGNTVDTVSVIDSVGNAATITIPVGPGITITQTNPVAPLQTTMLAATGGTGVNFQWSFASAASGGTLSPISGTNTGETLIGPAVNYTAGPYASAVDTVKVIDTFGNVGTIDILVGAGITISPSEQDPLEHNTFTLAPGGRQQFTASGGSGDDYVWTLLRQTSARSTVTPDGLYQAGDDMTEVKDTLQVVDSLGNSTTLVVEVMGDLPPSPTAPKSSGCSSTGAVTPAALALLALVGRTRRRSRMT